MARAIANALVILIIFTRKTYQTAEFGESLLLEDGSTTQVSIAQLTVNNPVVQHISIPSYSNLSFDIVNWHPDIAFIIFQIHTYQYNITLSRDKERINIVSNSNIFGSNVGLYVKNNFSMPMQVFLRSDNLHAVEALIVITGYNHPAPVPGGCNMEFNTVIAPHQKLVAQEKVIIVDAQPASPPILRDEPNCKRLVVQHDMYRMFVSQQDFTPHSYFSGITKMLTVHDIVTNGEKIMAAPGTSPMRRVYNAYTGVGSVYAVVSTYENHTSAYVPTFTYGCNPVLYPDSCQTLDNTLGKVFCAAIFLLGLFCILMVNSCHFLPPFYLGAICSYTLAIAFGSNSTEINLGIGLASGALAAGLYFYLRSMSLICGRIVFGISSGFFLTSIIYLHSAEIFNIMGPSFFWLLFLLLMLFVSILVWCAYHFTSYFVTILLEGFLIILPLDYYCGSNLKYIMIVIIRRIIVPAFSLANITPPAFITDYVLICVWSALTIYGLLKPWIGPSYLRYFPKYSYVLSNGQSRYQPL